MRRLCRSTGAAAMTPTRVRRPAQLRQRNQRRQTNSSPGGQPVSDQRQYRSVHAERNATDELDCMPPSVEAQCLRCEHVPFCAQRTPFNPVGNINMQPGLGIIPTLFGLQHGQGAYTPLRGAAALKGRQS